MQRLSVIPFRTTITCILGAATVFAATLFAVYPALAVMVIFSTIFLLVFVARPSWPYLLLIFLYQCAYFFVANKPMWTSYNIGELFLALLLILWFISRSINAVAPYPRTPCDVPLLLFVGLALLSILWSHDIHYGIDQTIRLFCVSIGSFILALTIVTTHEVINKITWIIIIMGVITSFTCFVAIHTYPDYTDTIFYKTKALRVIFMFNNTVVGKRGHGLCHPLTTALWLNIAFILSFGKFLTTKGRRKNLIGAMMFFMLTAHLTTISKGPLFALIGGVIFLIISLKPTKKIFFISISILILAIVTSFILANFSELKKIAGVTVHQMTFGDEQSSTASRANWWLTTMRKSLESYGFGVGIGGIRGHLDPPAPHPHNVYVSVFGELGFPGLGLLLLIYYIAFKTYFVSLTQCQSEYYRRIMLTYMGGFIMIMITIATDFSYTIDIIWWYIAFGFAIAKVAREAPAGFLEENLPFFKDGKSLCALGKKD